MKKRFTEEQIIGVLKEAEAGAKVAELCRKHGISEATYCNWKAKFGGVAAWDKHIGAVSASACHDNGSWSVADPRALPAANDKLVCSIVAEDGTWHRPFTTLELAALQSLYDPDDYAEAEDLARCSRWRARRTAPTASASATPCQRRPPAPWPRKSAAPFCCRAPANPFSFQPRLFGCVRR